MTTDWKEAARLFFSTRAKDVAEIPSLDDLCWIAGRDPRLWREPSLYEELIESIVSQLDLSLHHRLLEVGCAGGFLARGLASRCREYVGVDVAAPTLEVARRLRLPNATFFCEDAAELPFADASFERVVSYDVFTNFPDFAVAEAVVRQIWRVLRPGGRGLIGSIPDVEKAEEAAERAHALGEELTKLHGPPREIPAPFARLPFWRRLGRRRISALELQISCFSFSASQFEKLGALLGAATRISPIHPHNPYYGCRFNVVYEKPS
ncbi:MAG TPA: class I SAM-dependent methyltransferase [Myxococcota bacterium]|nr:class I SAM-dependent methyltransferase [Myxococcota bacterium]